MVGSSDDETNLTLKFLLINRNVAYLRKASANYLSTNIKLSRTQLYKMMQSGRFIGRFLGPFLKTRLPLTKNITVVE